jgi:hypothetical protein
MSRDMDQSRTLNLSLLLCLCGVNNGASAESWAQNDGEKAIGDKVITVVLVVWLGCDVITDDRGRLVEKGGGRDVTFGRGRRDVSGYKKIA